ncbi:MAG: TIGR03936 family radical SAM-associated protein [Lachnospiraceae bacterium]|nr:TIGR03936 family radical SAM-associated protein [Lachnospiraceae bacterium]
MNVRVRFAKYGAVKFIGHLDVLRYFQKAVRRSGLKIAYSQGFHPHQIMSFASPLGVGITSEGEYMDMELTAEYTPQEIVDALNSAMVEGFTVLSARILPEPENGRKRETAMSLVTAADYLVTVKENDTFFTTKSLEELNDAWVRFYGQESIPVVKKVKKSNTETGMDLKPFLFGAVVGTEVTEAADISLPAVTAHNNDNTFYEVPEIPDFAAEQKELCIEKNLFSVVLRVSAGSANNIKPELVMEAFVRFLGCEDPEALQFRIHRLDMYTGENPELTRL